MITMTILHTHKHTYTKSLWTTIWILSVFLLFSVGCKQQPNVPLKPQPSDQQARLETSLPTSTVLAEPTIIFPTIPPPPTPTPDRRVLTPALPQLSFTSPYEIDDSIKTNVEKAGSITILDTSIPLLWESGWCAHSPQNLTENLKYIDFYYFINGKEIPLNSFLQTESLLQDGALACRMNSLIIDGFQRGRYELIQKMIIKQEINDGQDIYSPTEKEIPYLVFVTEATTLGDSPITEWSQFESDEILSFWKEQSIEDEWVKATIKKIGEDMIISFEEVYKNSAYRLPPTIKRISSPLYYEVTFDSMPQTAINCFGHYIGYEYNQMSFIELEFCTNGEFSIQRYANDNWETLVERQEAHLPSLQNNYRLGVLLEETKATFYLNDDILTDLSEINTKGYLGTWIKAIKGSQVSLRHPILKLP